MKTFRGFDRISADPQVLAGKPCVRGLRLSVQRVLEILAQNVRLFPEVTKSLVPVPAPAGTGDTDFANPSWTDIQADYPELEPQDIQQVLAFAAAALNDTVIPLDSSAA